MIFEKLFVTSVKKIELGIEEIRIGVFVESTIVSAQETHETRTSLGRELTMKYNNIWSLRLVFILFILIVVVVRECCSSLKAPIDERLFRVDVHGAAHMPGLVLVGITRVDDNESTDLRAILATQQRAESCGRDATQVGMFGRVCRQSGQRVKTRTIANETLIGLQARALDLERLHDRFVTS